MLTHVQGLGPASALQNQSPIPPFKPVPLYAQRMAITASDTPVVTTVQLQNRYGTFAVTGLMLRDRHTEMLQDAEFFFGEERGLVRCIRTAARTSDGAAIYVQGGQIKAPIEKPGKVSQNAAALAIQQAHIDWQVEQAVFQQRADAPPGYEETMRTAPPSEEQIRQAGIDPSDMLTPPGVVRRTVTASHTLPPLTPPVPTTTTRPAIPTNPVAPPGVVRRTGAATSNAGQVNLQYGSPSAMRMQTITRANQFHGDQYTSHQHSVSSATTEAQVTTANGGAYRALANVKKLLGHPDAQNFPHRNQRDALVQRITEKLYTQAVLRPEVCTRLGRLIARAIAPQARLQGSSFGWGRAKLGAWKTRAQQRDFDTREVISDATRLQVASMALAMPLGSKPHKDILLGMQHWLNRRCMIPTSEDVYPYALCTFANILKARPPHMDPANLELLANMLQTQLTSLTTRFHDAASSVQDKLLIGRQLDIARVKLEEALPPRPSQRQG